MAEEAVASTGAEGPQTGGAQAAPADGFQPIISQEQLNAVLKDRLVLSAVYRLAFDNEILEEPIVEKGHWNLAEIFMVCRDGTVKQFGGTPGWLSNPPGSAKRLHYQRRFMSVKLKEQQAGSMTAS